MPTQAFLYQSGPACQIYLLADGSHCPAEDFLTTAADLHPDEFASLTRFLIEKGVVDAEALDQFIARIDAEDGVVDGKMELESRTRRLIVPEKDGTDGAS